MGQVELQGQTALQVLQGQVVVQAHQALREQAEAQVQVVLQEAQAHRDKMAQVELQVQMVLQGHQVVVGQQ
jgi:hypothetical protein